MSAQGLSQKALLTRHLQVVSLFAISAAGLLGLGLNLRMQGAGSIAAVVLIAAGVIPMGVQSSIIEDLQGKLNKKKESLLLRIPLFAAVVNAAGLVGAVKELANHNPVGTAICFGICGVSLLVSRFHASKVWHSVDALEREVARKSRKLVA